MTDFVPLGVSVDHMTNQDSYLFGHSLVVSYEYFVAEHGNKIPL